MKALRVLSLFDGISNGLVALKRIGIPVEVYYASEIKKSAIKISKHNHPEIVHVGDVLGDGWTVDVIAHLFKGLRGVKWTEN